MLCNVTIAKMFMLQKMLQSNSYFLHTRLSSTHTPPTHTFVKTVVSKHWQMTETERESDSKFTIFFLSGW